MLLSRKSFASAMNRDHNWMSACSNHGLVASSGAQRGRRLLNSDTHLWRSALFVLFDSGEADFVVAVNEDAVIFVCDIGGGSRVCCLASARSTAPCDAQTQSCRKETAVNTHRWRCLIVEATADVALACVDGAGRFLKMLVGGVMMYLRMSSPILLELLGSRDGIDVEPDFSEEFGAFRCAELFGEGVCDCDEADLMLSDAQRRPCHDTHSLPSVCNNA